MCLYARENLERREKKQKQKQPSYESLEHYSLNTLGSVCRCEMFGKKLQLTRYNHSMAGNIYMRQ